MSPEILNPAECPDPHRRIGQPRDKAYLTHGLTLTVLAASLQLILVWGFEFFPSVDGPAHVHLAYGMYEALTGDDFYRTFFELNDALNPNILIQAILVSLMGILSPILAEKVLLSLYFVSFAASSFYVLSGINRNSICLLPFLMFCSISFPLAFGFYNFSFSAVIFLTWYGFWWRQRESKKAGVILAHAGLAALAYLTHIFAFAVTWFAIAATSAGFLLADLQHQRRKAPESAAACFSLIRSHMLPPFLGSIPEVVAAAIFLFLRFGTHTGSGAADLWSLNFHYLLKLFFGSSLTPYGNVENIPALAFVLASLLLLCWLLRRAENVKNTMPLAICFLAFLVLYIAMPHQWIVRWMPTRFQPYVFLILLLWMALLIPMVVSRPRQHVIATLGMIILLASVISRTSAFSDINSYYREYVSVASHISARSTLVGLRLNNEVQGKPFPAETPVLFQLGSRVATSRHSVDLKNFQGQAREHPIQFRSGLSATSALGGNAAITSVPPRVNLLAYERQTNRPIDYVLIWGDRNELDDELSARSLYEQLDRFYSVAFISEPRGLMTLYKRNTSENAAQAF